MDSRLIYKSLCLAIQLTCTEYFNSPLFYWSVWVWDCKAWCLVKLAFLLSFIQKFYIYFSKSLLKWSLRVKMYFKLFQTIFIHLGFFSWCYSILIQEKQTKGNAGSTLKIINLLSFLGWSILLQFTKLLYLFFFLILYDFIIKKRRNL